MKEAEPHDAPAWSWRDIAALVICTLAWGTTWYAITLQLGVVDPVVSVVYRFAIAAAILFLWCLVRGEPIALRLDQHRFVFFNGFFTFALNYPLVYWAEERVASAVVAVLFAALAFGNLIGFRIAFGQRANMLAWIAAALGIAGVALLSWEEVVGAGMGQQAMFGVGLTLLAVGLAVFGNIYARRAELAGIGVASATAWSMAYGTAILAVFAVATGRAWTYEPTWAYTLSLLHLAIVGSVIAFLLYYALARSRGYIAASYISALTPPLAMLISTLLEGKSWGVLAIGGVAMVLSGQVLLMRARRT
ncbi:MAG: EamA family transporter [Hyphomonadaceae bacterium]|nr:EamA family transporter [Hyphomonadaceae bacterium]